MKLAALPLVVVSLALAGCATPETRLRTGLNNAGLSKAMSACMAERMVDRLSLLQLRRLSALGSLKDKQITDLSLAQFLHKTGTGQDYRGMTVGYNDIGIATAPDGTRYAIVVLMGEASSPVPARMATMQSVSRAVAEFHGK